MKQKQPNERLRHERESRGWSQKRVADLIDTSKEIIGLWERGERGTGKKYQEKLCQLFGKSAEELGFIQDTHKLESSHGIDTLPVSSLSTSYFLSSFYGASDQEICIPRSLFTPPLSVENTLPDWGVWFGTKLAQIITIVDQWQGQALYCDQLQTLLDQEILGFDAMKPQSNDESYLLSRRQALVSIATLPVALWTSVQQGITSASMTEKLLTRCAASITSLWHLLKGSELSLIEQTLSTYLLTLVTLAQQPSPYQKTAARLTSQAYRLYGIIALHRNNLKARENYCQQALYFSEIAENPSLIVSAHISLASTFYYGKNPLKAAQIYEKALLQKDLIPDLQHARIHAELAVAYAQQKREQDALSSLGLAQDLYPDYPENDPSFLYADFSPASMVLEKGLTYLALAQYFPDHSYKQDAWDSFARIEKLQAESSVPERIFFEVVNHQAETAVQLGNRELFHTYLEKGVDGANRLRSSQRRQEIREVYQQALERWPHESSMKKLEGILH